jgi:hypothetical protein
MWLSNYFIEFSSNFADGSPITPMHARTAVHLSRKHDFTPKVLHELFV